MCLIEIADWNAKIDETVVENELKIFDFNELTYSSFFENIVLKNVPCIIKNITSTWRCSKDWISNEIINFEYLIKHYGSLEASVANCDSLTYNAHCKTDLRVDEYMTYLQSDTREKLLYLKDWHLRKMRPDDIFYEVPPIFASDWLNEFAMDRGEDDFMFVYIGPQKSWTPLHADVYNSYSWSVNVVGRKKWILFPPGEENKLKDSLGNLPTMIIEENLGSIRHLKVIQEKNEALFVPSGWYHQVVNLLDTISVNHNWVNGCNIGNVWLSLEKCLVSVENEIVDLKDTAEFNTQCQLIVKAVFGMDFSDFLDFMCHIANKRIAQLQGKGRLGFSKYELGINHIKFDLKKIKYVINLVQHHPIFSQEDCITPSIKQNFISVKNTISEIELS